MTTITLQEYLKMPIGTVIVDVRSPTEFLQGHIANAINFPLLNDDERKIVGTVYKQAGHNKAVIKGFELVGGKFAQFLIDFEKLNIKNSIVLHCARGGLRSNIMAWLLEKGGYKISIIKGGYKQYRNWVLININTQIKLIVLGGKTGSNKTVLLQKLKEKNEPILDLEALANHRGSAFGGIGLGEQPSQEQFENNLAQTIYTFNLNHCVWVENESRVIGKTIIPSSIYDALKQAPLIDLIVDKETRAKNIIELYGAFDKQILLEKTMNIEKKLGNQNMRLATEALKNNDYITWVNYLLNYYDKTYDFSKNKREQNNILTLNFSEQTVLFDLIEAKNKLLNL